MAKLCKAGNQLRDQINLDYPNRSKKSDGWVADQRHLAKGVSDHIPDPESQIVRAIDVTADLGGHPEDVYALVNSIQ